MKSLEEQFAGVEGFQWDAGNRLKNWEKHKVSTGEAEEVFFNRPILFAEDDKHSSAEARFLSLGRTQAGRKLSAVFVIRKNLIRVISARDMSPKERKAYEKID